jgi:hypothetical protein
MLLNETIKKLGVTHSFEYNALLNRYDLGREEPP